MTDVAPIAAGMSVDSGGNVNAPAAAPSNATVANLMMGPQAPAAAKAPLVSSAPARTATASNITKLQTITQPAAQGTPGYTYVNGLLTSVGGQQINNPLAAPQGVSTGVQQGPPAPSPVTVNHSPDGSMSTTYGAPPSNPNPSPTGTSTPSTSATDYDAAVKSISDPGLAAQYKSSLQNFDSEAATAQSNIDTIKNRSLNDPAVTGITSAIQAKYDQLKQIMQDKNAQLIGRANTSVAAFGGLGVMSQGFLNDQQSRADARIQDLQNQEDSAIAKAQAAYVSNNAKDLNDAMTQYDKINQDKLTALNQLLTASSKAVTEAQGQQKIDLQTSKAQLASDVTTSTKIAAGVVARLKESGITDEDQMKQYIQQIATQYGITNPDILYSQVVAAGQTADKNTLGMQNTQSEIDTRAGNLANSTTRLSISAAKAAKGTAADKKNYAKDTLNAALTPGSTATLSDGTTPVMDPNGHINPDAFKALVAGPTATAAGINRAAFLSQYGNLLYRDADGNISPEYGLTPKEVKAITTQAP